MGQVVVAGVGSQGCVQIGGYVRGCVHGYVQVWRVLCVRGRVVRYGYGCVLAGVRWRCGRVSQRCGWFAGEGLVQSVCEPVLV